MRDLTERKRVPLGAAGFKGIGPIIRTLSQAMHLTQSDANYTPICQT